MMVEPEEPVRELRDALRERLGEAHDGGGFPVVTVTVHTAVSLVEAAAWTAWVLAVFPADVDPVLVAAASLQAHGLEPAPASRPVLDLVFPDDEPARPAPGYELLPAVIDVRDGRRVLAVLAAPPPHALRSVELTSASRELARAVRRLLPGSMAWSVASLPGPALALYERAARIAASSASTQVDVGHLVAAVLLEADMESVMPFEVPWPDPADGVLALLVDARGAARPESAVRERLAGRLATGLPLPDQRGVDLAARADPWTVFVGAVTAQRIPGVRLVAAEDSATAATPNAEPDPIHAATERDPILVAAREVAIHLGRTDTTTVSLAGPAPARDAVLAQLAALATEGKVPALRGRAVLAIDASVLTPISEEQLLTALTLHAPHLAVAISHAATRLGAALGSAASKSAVPTILLSAPRRDPAPHDVEAGSVPWVQIGGAIPREETTAELLAPIAAELAAAHAVSLAPGVLRAAAAPLPQLRARRDPIDAFLDDEQGALAPDPVALGRARLDYACARAGMRPDRRVTVADVPLDPSRGVAASASPPETQRNHQFQERLGMAIIDQPQAVHAIGQRLELAAHGLRRTGPRATMLLAGPPGTGKTHTANVVADLCYGDPKALIRVDCGALYDHHTIGTLLGAPPAYVGYDDRERLLTSQISSVDGRCVVLFDEIEKADRRVLDILLGVLDSGHLTDLQQRTADATQAIFVLTSNLGSALFTRTTPGFTPMDPDQVSAAVLTEVRSHLRPELLDRIDDVVVYRPLTHEGILELTTRHLATLTADLEAHGYHVHMSREVADALARRVQAIGVRGLRRYLETAILRDLLTQPPGYYQASHDGESSLRWSATDEDGR